MAELFGNWIRGLAGVAVFSAIALTLTPSGRVKNVLRALCGLIMVIALLRPLIGIDLADYGRSLAKYRESLIARTDTEAGDRLSRIIIENETRAYILDKAAGLGLAPQSVSVSARWANGFWVPDQVSVTGPTGADAEALSNLIEAQLGIPKDRQHWSDANETEP